MPFCIKLTKPTRTVPSSLGRPWNLWKVEPCRGSHLRGNCDGELLSFYNLTLLQNLSLPMKCDWFVSCSHTFPIADCVLCNCKPM
ncbi:hypothetical protein H671_2g5552 [Cricetulus griseus]|nr:hypothetical protein H671_2g5552 [Cricetulus griseus]